MIFLSYGIHCCIHKGLLYSNTQYKRPLGGPLNEELSLAFPHLLTEFKDSQSECQSVVH